MPSALPAFLATLACGLGLLTGCGEQRAAPPDVSTPAPAGTQRTLLLEKLGLTMTVPRSWADLSAKPPLVGGIESGRAALALWRYPRAEPLPQTPEQLRRVRDLLGERVRKRDPSYQPSGPAKLTVRAGAPAVELTGTQTIAGKRVGVRSAHVFRDAHELVVDAYAPPEHFERVDRTVFEPAFRSLTIEAPRR